MWILIIVAIVICCIVAGIAQSSEDAATEQRDQNIRQIAAKRPDAFIRLFQEEFPDFAEDITFSKAESAIEEWNRALESNDYKQHLSFFNKSQFKDADAAQKARRFLMGNVANEISSEFLEHVLENPIEDSFNAMHRIIRSSLTLAGE
ncbi:MAG: hypothetical protein AAF423_06530 [Pseudomonadota bacterium]